MRRTLTAIERNNKVIEDQKLIISTLRERLNKKIDINEIHHNVFNPLTVIQAHSLNTPQEKAIELQIGRIAKYLRGLQ